MDDIERRIIESYAERERQQQESEYFNWKKTEPPPNLKKEPLVKPSTNKPQMKNKIQDLRNHLFETIEKLKEGEINIEQARAMADLAQVVVNSAKVEVDFLKAANVKSSYFFPIEEAKELA